MSKRESGASTVDPFYKEQWIIMIDILSLASISHVDEEEKQNARAAIVETIQTFGYACVCFTHTVELVFVIGVVMKWFSLSLSLKFLKMTLEPSEAQTPGSQ